MNFEEKMYAYRLKANQIQAAIQSKKDQTIDRVRHFYDTDSPNGQENYRKAWLNLHLLAEDAQLRPTLMQARIEVTDEDQFTKIDKFFFDTFCMSKYFQVKDFSYPIIYCETLEEFFEAYISDLSLSRTGRGGKIDKLVKECEQNFKLGKSVIQGVDISGVGCYLNGWLFGAKFNLVPKAVLKIPEFAEKVAEVAIHEKIGHGFLTMYSTLGQTLNALGTRNVNDAEQFSREVYTDPLHSLRQKKYDALLVSSWYQQEGWATWIESYISSYYYKKISHPKYQFETLKNAIEALQTKNKEEQEFKQGLVVALVALLDDITYPPEVLLKLLDVFKQIPLTFNFNEQLTKTLKQPLQYVLGQLLMLKVEINAGMQCVPHAALLAGNIKLDANEIGLEDLKVLLNTEPRSNTDARLAMISKIKLTHINDVMELASRCEEDLSIPVPIIYKQSK